jgi:hypothetical protein
MKFIPIIVIIWLLILAGCCSQPSSVPPAFLPGIYVNENKTEFSRVLDTLFIRKVNLDSVLYQVTRKCSFQRIRQGKSVSIDYQSEKWIAHYDLSQQLLQADKKEKALQYDPDGNKIAKGNIVYEKVE